ncbi:hypothetical protein GCM10009677_40480 [Sphaerisporangium rubeum]|uniref:Uncharacterized protein n=1 Tax=Sphaerisporangium rubeum TaxID=321317 RepID=A0A7X0M9V2_9ACTN|nr:hypothetical protein [Sphaerisporangium rubeum]MBB6475429.1 hypothetical protein [Sphaerisporangium rubeum]
MAERWCDWRVVLRVLVSAAVVLLLLHGLGAHTSLGAALPVPADAAPGDGSGPASDHDGCPEQGEQTGEAGCVRPPSQQCRDHCRRSCGRASAGEPGSAGRAAIRSTGSTGATGSPGRRSESLLSVFRC